MRPEDGSAAASGFDLAWCDGSALHRFFAGGLAALERCATAVDRLNVFPVPDGDTGTNLRVTVTNALRAVDAPAAPLGGVARRLAVGALEGARGNSGVIFAQLCGGLSLGFAGLTRADARRWAEAWQAAARAAHQSVAVPVEGTILTVARAAADAAESAAGRAASLVATWEAMAEAADDGVARTTGMLEVLREAQVVDAGALGLALFLRGGLAAFTGAPLPDPDAVMRPTAQTRRVIESAEFPRYCTEFLIAGAGIDREAVLGRLGAHGRSLEVVLLDGEGVGPRFRVHIHTDDADSAIALGGRLGAVAGIKVEDMRRQRARFLATGDGLAEATMAAVAAGPGLRRVFESLHGVGLVLEPGENGDIGAGELRAALAHAPGRGVIVLPNSERLLEPARAAAAACGKPARVIATTTVPQGVAAALAFDEGAALEENARAMTRAAGGVRTLLVGRSAAGEGGAFARLDGRTVATGRGLVEAATGAARALEGEAELITVYYGVGASGAEAEEVARRLEQRFPGAESQVVHGGQPDWPLLIGLEGDGGPGRH